MLYKMAADSTWNDLLSQISRLPSPGLRSKTVPYEKFVTLHNIQQAIPAVSYTLLRLTTL